MNIIIYGRDNCPYCDSAKHLASSLEKDFEDVNYLYIDLKKNDISKKQLEDILDCSVTTVPQVVINGKVIGGYTEFKKYVESHEEYFTA